MEELLLVLFLRLKVLEEDDLEESGFEEHINERWSILDDSDVKEESGS